MELKELLETTQIVADIICRAFQTQILTIGINHNEPTSIGHLHIHILPRYRGDEGGIIQSIIRGRIIDDLRPRSSKNP